MYCSWMTSSIWEKPKNKMTFYTVLMLERGKVVETWHYVTDGQMMEETEENRYRYL